MNFTQRYTVDLARGKQEKPMQDIMVTGDNAAQTIEVEVLQNGAPVTISGAVTGQFIRSIGVEGGGITVPLTGSAAGNVASVTLTKPCYYTPGACQLTITVTDATSATSIFVGVGNVILSTSEQISNNENIIPSLQEIQAATINAQEATSAANTAAGKANTAAGTANSAAGSATQAAQSANSAAQAAETATGDANDAASAANTAASKANTAAGAANTAAGSVQTAIDNAETATDAANSAAGSATQAAQSANSAAQAAETATGDANDAASAANTAAGKANTAAGKADDAAAAIDGMTASATTLAAGSAATAAVSDVSGHKHIAIGVPKGDTGATPEITFTVETGEPGTQVQLSQGGTVDAPTVHLTIPRGDTGAVDGIDYYAGTPAALGTGTPGTANGVARGDHVHPMPTAADIEAMSTWGEVINSGYNNANGDVYIRRVTANNTNALLLSPNTYLYRIVNDVNAYRIFDEGMLPWGGETHTMITQEMVTGCTLQEPTTCTVFSRCGLCFATLSGVKIDANVSGTVTIPYTSKLRSEAWMLELGGGTSSRLCYIDAGSNIIHIFANSNVMNNGYCTLIFALNM